MKLVRAARLALAVAALPGSALAQPATPTPAPPPATPAPGPPPGASKPTVTVRFLPTEPNVVLERAPERRRGDRTDREGWTAICVAGCTVELERGRAYQVGGTYVSPAPVSLPPGPGPFVIRATPGSERADAFGTGWLVAGAATLLVGGSAALALGVTGATKNEKDGSAMQHFFVSSLVTAGVGLVLVVTSLAFRLGNQTTVHVEQGLARRGVGTF